MLDSYPSDLSTETCIPFIIHVIPTVIKRLKSPPNKKAIFKFAFWVWFI